MEHAPPPIHFTAKQAADYLRISTSYLRRLCKKQGIVAFRLSGTGRYRYHVRDIERLMQPVYPPTDAASLDAHISKATLPGTPSERAAT